MIQEDAGGRLAVTSGHGNTDPNIHVHTHPTHKIRWGANKENTRYQPPHAPARMCTNTVQMHREDSRLQQRCSDVSEGQPNEIKRAEFLLLAAGPVSLFAPTTITVPFLDTATHYWASPNPCFVYAPVPACMKRPFLLYPHNTNLSCDGKKPLGSHRLKICIKYPQREA